ncbi:hypothetical protein IKQ21_00515 [bacterium]|nr:hypothetical protein [bacterium]
MGTVEALKTGFSLLWKSGWKSLPKGRVNPETLRYVPKMNMSAPVDEFVRTTSKGAGETKKVITDLDRVLFKQYVFQKKFDLKITAEEISNLLSIEGEQYYQKAFEFLVKKMKISKNVEPNMIFSASNTDASMAYRFFDNVIAVNTNNLSKLDKISFLVILRHELQHWNQCMQMFRHETKGKEFAEFWTKLTNWNNESLTKYIKNAPDELEQILGTEHATKIMNLKKLMEAGKTAEYEKDLTEFTEILQKEHLQAYQKWRDTIIKELGVLKADTKEAKRAEKMMRETMDENGYYLADGKINLGKYYGDCRENESLTAQSALTYKILELMGYKQCPIQDAKSQIKSGQFDALYEQVGKEIGNKYKTENNEFDIKKLISYLYD